MNRKIYALVAFLCMAFAFSSCSDDDDNNAVSQEWKDYNQKKIKEVIADPTFKGRESLSGNGSVYWKKIDFSADIKSDRTPKITPEGTPYFNDTIICRYEGWYYNLNDKKVVFDSTEGSANAQNGRKFEVNGVIDGWTTMLQYMKVGDEVEFCIPYQLAYGVNGQRDSFGNVIIPGYTTLWFKMKLLKIMPVNPGEFD